MGVSKKSVSWTLTFVTTVLQGNRRRSDVTFLVRTFWTPPYVVLSQGCVCVCDVCVQENTFCHRDVLRAGVVKDLRADETGTNRGRGGNK